jgi:release factor glutamine methyltransferase
MFGGFFYVWIILNFMRVREKLKLITLDLGKSGVVDPGKEAELIIVNASGIAREMIFRDDPVLSADKSARIDEYVTRRVAGEPLQYILGYVEFYGLKIHVGRGVLIPRPETELIVDAVVKTAMRNYGSELRVLDLCTGSGCLALAIAKSIPGADVYATDISGEALQYAHENARHNTIHSVTFLQGDLFDPVNEKKFDIVVSNPPYIKSADIPELQREIREWEPLQALDAGKDGLQYYRKIIRDLDRHLMEDGQCFLEIGFDQRKDVAALARKYGFISYFKKDLSGHYRIAILSF